MIPLPFGMGCFLFFCMMNTTRTTITARSKRMITATMGPKICQSFEFDAVVLVTVVTVVGLTGAGQKVVICPVSVCVSMDVCLD